MTNWSNDRELEFMEVYQTEPVLWDTSHRSYKDRHAVYEAWCRISDELNIPVAHLKKKKDSMMATYRMHRRKARASGSEDSYNPMWFAFELMHSFLGKASTSNTPINSTDVEEIEDIIGVKYERPEPTISRRNRHQTPELAEAGQSSNEGLRALSDVLYCQQGESHQLREDDCDLYGKLLATKLRKLPEHDRLSFMHEIDGMYIRLVVDK